MSSHRHNYVEILFLARMFPELEVLEFAGDNPFVTNGDLNERVESALNGLAKSWRPSPPRQLDPLERVVSGQKELWMHRNRLPKPHDKEHADKYLDNEDRLRAMAALLEIHARGVPVDKGKLITMASKSVDAVTSSDLGVPEDIVGIAVPTWWYKQTDDDDQDDDTELPHDLEEAAKYAFGEAVARLEKHMRKSVEDIGKDAIDSYDKRVEEAQRSVEALHGILEPKGRPDSLREGYAELSDELKRDLSNALPSLVDTATSCRAEPIRMPDGKDAVRITASYTSDRPVEDFIFPANPLNWPKLSNSGFFKKMGRPEPLIKLEDLDDPRHNGYTTTLREEVSLGDPSMVTDLNIRFFVAPGHGDLIKGGAEQLAALNRDAQFVGMSFDYANSGDGNIDVDHGYMHVRKLGDRTLIEAAKTVRFRTRPNETSTWACQLGWVESMKRMNQWWIS